MKSDQRELLERLKLEIQVIEKGGYYPSVRAPHRELRIFRDSVSCLNVGLEEKVEPCTHCFLMQFVPPDKANEEDPCQHIPLTAAGDSVVSMEAEGRTSEEIQRALLEWLRQRVIELEAAA
jgi:hypothetical protein